VTRAKHVLSNAEGTRRTPSLQNYKFETRNPKQFQMTKNKTSKDLRKRVCVEGGTEEFTAEARRTPRKENRQPVRTLRLCDEN